MRTGQNAVFNALERSQGFLDDNAAALTAVDFTAARKRLDDVVNSFSSHAFDQDTGERGAKGETAKQLQLRLKLRSELMEPIAIIARRNLRSVPEFKALQMPKASARGQAFIASADGMTAAATVHKDTLVAHGLPSTFLDDLKNGVAKLQTSYTDREKSRTQRVGATKGLTVEEKNGRTVLSVLDALVKQALGGSNDALLSRWNSVRRIRRTTANTSNTSATTSATPAAGTSAPAPATTPTVPATTPAAPAAPETTPVPGAATTPTTA